MRHVVDVGQRGSHHHVLPALHRQTAVRLEVDLLGQEELPMRLVNLGLLLARLALLFLLLLLAEQNLAFLLLLGGLLLLVF